MNKKNTVFVGILDGDEILVSTTLKGVCRMMGLGYLGMFRSWKRFAGEAREIGGCEKQPGGKVWRIMEKDLDTTWRKGNEEFGKTIKAPKKGEVVKKEISGTRGIYKGNDGLLHQKPEKKRTLADDIVVHKQRIASEGADPEYEGDEV